MLHIRTLLEATNAGLNESYIDKLIDDQISVSSSMTEQFAPVKALIKENNTDEANNDNACQNLQLKLPEIKLPSFSDNNENVFDYLNFKLLFSNTIKLYEYLPTTTKFTMLKNSLKGRALSLIENLALDEVYENAWKLLDQVFLDKEAVVNSCFSKITDRSPCHSLKEVEEYLDEVIKNVFTLSGLNVKFEDDSSGILLMSYVVRQKLPKYFLQEIIRKTGEINPSIDVIIENSKNVVKLLTINSSKKTDKIESASAKESSKTTKYPPSSFSKDLSKTNFPKTSESKGPKGCNFCLKLNHSSVHCKMYATWERRRARAVEMGKCAFCLSKNHKAEGCPGLNNKLFINCASCGQKSHVTPMCPTPQLSFSASKVASSSEKVK